MATAALAAIAAGSLSAQKPAPAKRASGDTLRFQQTMKMSQTMEGTPAGPMSNAMDSESRLVVAFGNGDTLQVWMESAKAHMTTPMGDMDPDMGEMLNKHYVMTLDAGGHLKTISSPKLAADDPMGLSSALSGDQTFGFDLALPSQPLKPGVTWADTVDKKAPADSEQKINMAGTNNSTVVGDTTVDDMPVVAIDVKSVTKTTGTISMANAGMTMTINSQDNGAGRIYYSPALRLVVKREVNTNGTGSQTMEGPVSMSMTTSQKIETKTTLIH
jgi:hypothetical protein